VTLPRGAIRTRNLGRSFDLAQTQRRSLKEQLLRRERTPRRTIWALRHVDLEIEPGEAFGIVGQNGSGKSTLLKLLARIFGSSEGTVQTGGRIGSLLELGAGFHPDFTGVENVYLNAAIHGIPRSYIDEHLQEILDFAELVDYADMPVRTYSSGMFMRLGFSVAMHVNPDILLLDEVLAVGDESFQQKCFARIWDFRRNGGTIVFVSHDASSVERLCNRAILLEHGRVVAEGAPDEVFRSYHRRLAARPVATAGAAPVAASESGVRVLEVRACGVDGIWRDRFVEGEPMMIEAHLQSDAEHHGVHLTIGLTEVDGHLIGAQTLSGFYLEAGVREVVRLHLNALPLREGAFHVGVGLTSHDGDRELVDEPQALQLSVFASDAGASGPMRLGGMFSVPNRSEERLAGTHAEISEGRP
jgi:ABC-type polysaccharide/polyol phosphate transport system ATPase subunit